MIRGTTPTHIFKLPMDTATISEAKVIYAQVDKIILTKALADCAIEENALCVTLTQEETFLFNCAYQVQIQLRVLTIGGDALASPIMEVPVGKCLDREVIT